jgi:rhodanese-related sulfurtransferase
MDHSTGFLNMVNEARPRVKEISLSEALEKLSDTPGAVLLDVREDYEWNAGHVKKATHLGRGVLERDIEKRFPDKATPLLMYCGGGFRSVLAADSAQKMGYNNVFSIEGGYKAMQDSGWPIET